jgi:predicted transcriptional regulator
MTQKGMDMYHKYRPFYGRDTATVLMALVDNSSAMTVAELCAYLHMTNSKVVKGVVALDEAGIIEEISYNDEPMYKFKG